MRGQPCSVRGAEVSASQRGNSITSLGKNHGLFGRVPTPAFSAAFKSPELDLSAKQARDGPNKLAQYSIHKFEVVNPLREKLLGKQGSQASEIHQIDSIMAPLAPPSNINSKDNDERV